MGGKKNKACFLRSRVEVSINVHGNIHAENSFTQKDIHVSWMSMNHFFPWLHRYWLVLSLPLKKTRLVGVISHKVLQVL